MAETARVVVAVAQTSEPVTLTQAKEHLRITHTSDDQLVEQLVTVAREYVERRSGFRLMTQTLDCYYNAAPDLVFELPVGPVQSITSIKTYDAADVEATLSGSTYALDAASLPARVSVDAWPTGLRSYNAVVVRVVAGYASASAVPATLRHAILLLVGELYERREDATTDRLALVPLAASRLIAQLRLGAGVA